MEANNPSEGVGPCLLVAIQAAVAIIFVIDTVFPVMTFYERKCHFLPITPIVTGGKHSVSRPPAPGCVASN